MFQLLLRFEMTLNLLGASYFRIIQNTFTKKNQIQSWGFGERERAVERKGIK